MKKTFQNRKREADMAKLAKVFLKDHLGDIIADTKRPLGSSSPGHDVMELLKIDPVGDDNVIDELVDEACDYCESLIDDLPKYLSATLAKAVKA